MADEINTVLLRYSIDKSALSQTVQGTNQLKKAITDVASDIRSKFASSATELGKRFRDNTRDAKDYGNELRRLHGEIDKTAAAQKKLGSNKLGAIGQGAGALAQVAGGVGGSAAGEGLRLLGDFTGALESAGPLAAAGAVALGGLSLAMAEQTRQSELARAEVEKHYNAIKTDIALQRQLSDLEESRDVAGAQSKLNQLIKDQLDAQTALGVLYHEQSQLEAQLAAQGEEKLQVTLDQLAKTKELIATDYNLFTQRSEEITALEALIPKLQAQVDLTNQATSNVKGFFEGLKGAVSDAEQFIDKTAKNVSSNLKTELTKQEAQKSALANATQRFNDDIAKLEESNFEKRAELTKNFNNKLVDLATQAADAAENALAKLQDERASLLSEFVQGEADAQQQAQLAALDAQIQSQREEARSLREHERNLAAIRDRAADSELEAIADRDFRSLFFQRRQTARELSNASQTFVDERSERQIAAQEASQDRVRQAEIERTQRLTNYQQQLNEAQQQYSREQQQIAQNLVKQRQIALQNYQREQQELASNLTQQLTLRRQAAITELQFLSQTEAQRARILAQAQNQLLAQASQLLNAVSGRSANSLVPTITPTAGGPPLRRRALGGSLSAGQSALVNEMGSSGRESFTAGGQTVALPGFGVFTPSRGGQVNANGGGGITLHQTNHIHGVNPDQILDRIDERTMYLMNKALGIRN